MDGVLLIDKPAGITSHGVVAAVRRTLAASAAPAPPPGQRRVRERVGHAGTLDPFATGLLLVLVGRATRVQSLLMGLRKSYEVVAAFGAVSTTGDPEGDITVTGQLPPDPLELPQGELMQRPPRYSAIKVGGERSYARARRGEDFELAERPVNVYRFQQLWRADERAAFAIDCSAGTYVRSLVADLGDAYCVELRRTAIGPFSIADAVAVPTPAGGEIGSMLSLERALAFLPALRVEGEAARVAAHGVAVAAARGIWESAPVADEQVLLLDDGGALAVAEQRLAADGLELKPVIGFRG